MKRRSLLLSAALLPAVGGVAIAADKADAHGFTVDAAVLLRMFQATVESQAAAMLSGLKAIAVTSEAHTATWEAMRPLLRQIADSSATLPNAWIVWPNGAYSNTVNDGPARFNLADRDYFDDLMRGDDVQGDVVISKSTRQRTLIIATPIAEGARVKAALGLSISCRMIMQVVQQSAQMPDDLAFAAVDDAGQIALHSQPQMLSASTGAAAPPFAAALPRILSQESGQLWFDIGGRKQVAVFNRSKLLGWRFVLTKAA